MWARHVEQMSPEAAVARADSDAEPAREDWAQVETMQDFVPLRTADVDFSTGGGGGGGRGVVLRPLPLVCDGVGEHWEQRLGVELAQGEASLVLGAVASARANAEGITGRKASPEWSPTDYHPCVTL
jgi:hypothetical protein